MKNNDNNKQKSTKERIEIKGFWKLPFYLFPAFSDVVFDTGIYCPNLTVLFSQFF